MTTSIKTQADLDWEIQCYGMTEGSVKHLVESQAFPGTELMFAAGILSDAQEILSAEWNPNGVDAHHANRARQMINCAKYIMFNQMREERAAA
jgi:hypothetical protein